MNFVLTDKYEVLDMECMDWKPASLVSIGAFGELNFKMCSVPYDNITIWEYGHVRELPYKAPKPSRDFDSEIRDIRRESSKRRKSMESDTAMHNRVNEIGAKMEKAWESRKKASETLPPEPEIVTDWNKIGVSAAAQIGSVALAAGSIALGATLAPLLTIPAILGLNYAWLKSKEEKL